MGFVPCNTSHPFFLMTLMPLWFLVFKGHDLLHAQVYAYVYTYTRVKLSVKLHMYVFFFLKRNTGMCISLNMEPTPASFFMKVCLCFTSELVYFCMFQAALQSTCSLSTTSVSAVFYLLVQ